MNSGMDWSECRRHFEAWWNLQQADRPTVAFWAPRDKPLPGPAAPPDPEAAERRYLDAAYISARAECFLRENRLFGDAFPHVDVDLGPGSMALYLGSEPGFSRETVWFHPLPDLLTDPESVDLPRFDPDNRWWRTHLELIRRAVDFAEGRWLVTVPDLVENIDILAALRGAQNLLVDLYDRPQWVRAWLRRLDDLYFEYFDRIYDMVKGADGSNAYTAFWVWAPGRMAKIQCDFSAMIGPDMFAEFVLPGLVNQCSRLDYAVYHLDGPEALCHVPHLCSIPGLNAIQWTPGAGNPGTGDPCWFDMYHQVLDAGKGLLLMGPQEPQARQVAREFGTRGIYMFFNPLGSESEGEDLMRRIYDW